MRIPDAPPPCQHSSATPRGWLTAVAVAVALLTIWVHWPAGRNEFVHWDDYAYLETVARHPRLNGATIRWAFGTTGHDYYSPLTWLSYVAQVRDGACAAAAFHRTSVVLHGLNAGLVVLLSGMILRRAGPLAAGAVGLCFALHPVQVESVAWVAERKTVLCGFFCLLSALAYLRAAAGATGRRGWWLATVGCYIAALLSKPMAVSLPGALLALDMYPLRRFNRVGWKRCVVEKLPLLALAIAAGWLTFVSARQVGAVEASGVVSVLERVSIGARAFGFYVWKLVWPAELSPFYSFDGILHLGRPDVLAGLAAIGVFTVLSVVFYRRSPAGAAAWLGFGAFLLPVSGIVQTGAQAAADRYLYLPVVPVSLLVAAGFGLVWRRLGMTGRGALATWLVCYLLFFAYRTRGQIAVWRNDVTLWQAALAYDPASAMASRQLAAALQREGRYAEALVSARRTVEVAPHVADAQATLGTLYWELGRDEEAIAALERALRLDPNCQPALYFLARCYVRSGQTEAARAAVRRLIELDPELEASLRQEADLVKLYNP